MYPAFPSDADSVYLMRVYDSFEKSLDLNDFPASIVPLHAQMFAFPNRLCRPYNSTVPLEEEARLDQP